MTLLIERKETPLEIAQTGEFEVRIASKRDGAGNYIVDKDNDVYGENVVGEKSIIVGCFNHGNSCPGPAGIGKTQETNGAYSDIRAVGRLLLETEHGRDEYARWKALGSAAKFSYVYRVLDADFIEVSGKRVRRLLKLDIISVDLVSAPAGVGTGIISLKASPSGGCSSDACTCGGLSDAEKQRLLEIKSQLEARTRTQLERQRLRFLAIQGQQILGDVAAHSAKARVPQRLLDTAQRAAVVAAEELGVPVPTIHYFTPQAGQKELGGFTRRDGAIHLSSELGTQSAVVMLVGHEMKHVSQPDDLDDDLAEVEAYSYGAYFLREKYAEITSVR